MAFLRASFSSPTGAVALLPDAVYAKLQELLILVSSIWNEQKIPDQQRPSKMHMSRSTVPSMILKAA